MNKMLCQFGGGSSCYKDFYIGIFFYRVDTTTKHVMVNKPCNPGLCEEERLKRSVIGLGIENVYLRRTPFQFHMRVTKSPVVSVQFAI
ncbi:hypothetical protein CEXT_700541 [Caerostris extrusa]|uniref:Uncharacterized protein n=1 Tax=Caerostris extrusa TaxID=172846 RepID=A0AAV4UI46_CAEEX|nr:hypothetical protein CEXT_700541 [Caerostris extrusa]